jgi:hypothetical protein
VTRQQLENIKASGKILMTSFDRIDVTWVEAGRVHEFKARKYQDLSHLSDAALINMGILERDA